MKSSRESALTNRSSARPTGVELPHDAAVILKRLHMAKAYGSRRKYEKELKSLAEQYPDMADEIFKLKVWI